MSRIEVFFRELRRRSVFRVAGIYIGVAWILIEVASVLLPVFNFPEQALRWMFFVAFIGFPIALAISWAFELTEEGLIRDEKLTESSRRVFGGRSRDLIAIGVLSTALVFSIYLNVTLDQEAEEEREPVSVLIADFDNRTGISLFSGSLEQALTIGIEGAPFIASFSRYYALAKARELGLGEQLTEEVSRRMSVSAGIDLVLVGIVEPAGTGFKLAVTVVDPANGNQIASASTNAKSTADALAAVGILSEKIRKALGDDSGRRGTGSAVEMLDVGSLEAVQNYARAQDLALAGNHKEALSYYEKAVEQAPNFAGALSGWALSLFALGHTEKATALWERALQQMHSMTERERFRTLGSYYMAVAGNHEKARASYQSLVEKYPADALGHYNLAIASFATLDFQRALMESRRALEINPAPPQFYLNYALYAMYAGHFETAESGALKTLETDPARFEAWLPVAVAALNRREYEVARETYRKMAETSVHGKSVASLGLADIELYLGNFAEAVQFLAEGIAYDQEFGNQLSISIKLLALAEAHAALNDTTAEKEALAKVLGTTTGLALEVPAARLLVALGEQEQAGAIATSLRESLQPQARAYGLLTETMVRRGELTDIEVVTRLREALVIADLWLVHFELAKAYLHNGYFAEALDELTICEARRGEAAALFLDNLPTWRYLATLPYWTGRAQQGLGIDAAARSNFEIFLALRPDGGPLAEDARRRLQ